MRADDKDMEAARAAAEAAKLQLEAAKMRAEADELKRATDEQRRKSRAGVLLAGSKGADGEYALSLEELPARLKDVANIEATQAEVDRLAASVGRTGLALRYEDLVSEAFDLALNAIITERREQELAKQARERAAKAEEQASTRFGDGTDQGDGNQVIEGWNDDRGQQTRILASLAYLVPLIDLIRFGIPLAQLVPIFFPILALVSLPAAIVAILPFGLGSLAMLAGAIILSGNKEIPRLIRFNLLQAVYLDLLFFFLSTIVTFAVGGPVEIGGPPEPGALLYLALILVTGNCVITNLNGEYPDYLPIVSAGAKQNVDQQR